MYTTRREYVSRRHLLRPIEQRDAKQPVVRLIGFEEEYEEKRSKLFDRDLIVQFFWSKGSLTQDQHTIREAGAI